MPSQNFHHLEKAGDSSQVEIKKSLNSNEMQSHSKSVFLNSTNSISPEQLATLGAAESKVWQGIKLEQENKLFQAVEYYRQAVELNSQSAVAHHILAIALKKQNNLVEADYYHRLALSLGQQNSAEYNNPSENLNSSVKNTSEYSLPCSDLTIAPTQSKTISNLENSSITSTKSSSTIVLPKLTAVAPGTYVENNQLEVTKIYLQQAKLYYSDARWQETIDACEEALKICSDLPETYKIYGNSLQQMGKVPEAMGYYAKALERDPHLAEVYANIGSLYAKQENWQEAVNYYQKALTIDPKQAKICLHLSKAWERLGEDEPALQALFQALSFQPEILTVPQYIQLVNDLLSEGELQLAITCCEHGVKIQPPVQALYLKLIKILEQDGQLTKATRYRQILANLSENSPPRAAKKLRIQRLFNSTTAKNLPAINAGENSNSNQQKLNSNIVGNQKLLSHNTTEESLTIEQYLNELTKQPNSSKIRLNLANLYAQQKQWQEAVSYYKQAITIEPSLAIAYLRLGKIYGILGKHLQGAELIYRAYSIQPEMGTAEQHYKLGEFWLEHHKGKVAMSCYRRAVELKPDFHAAYSRLKQLIALKNKQSAKLTEGKATHKAVSLSQSEEATQDREYYKKAIAAVKANDWRKADQYYQEAIKINPQQYRYYYNLGEVQVKLDRRQLAIKCYQKAAELEPNNADIQHNLGEVYSLESSWANAVTAYKKAIVLGSQKSWTYHNLGYALLQLQQWESAANYFTQAISFRADFVWSHYNLGEALSNIGQLDGALAAYQAAHKIDPNLSEPKTKIGGILYQRSQQSQQQALSFCKNQIAKDPDNVELYHQAISLDKKDPELYLGLGRALVKQGKIDEAVSIYQVGLQIQPHNTELVEECDRLKTQKIASSPANIIAKVGDVVNSAPSNQENIQDDGIHLPNHSSPVVSIIIPAYNHADYTIKCLRSIANHIPIDSEVEVIVINDCSTDNTAATLNQVIGLKRIDNEENLGFLHFCNRGVEAASGEYIYFLNNDTELLPQALEHLLSVFEQDPEVGAVGSKLIYPDGSLQEAGGIVFKNASAWNYGTKGNPSAPQYNYLRSVDYCSGASLLVKKTVLAALGSFDAHFAPAYYEDTNLCFAIRHHLGLKVIYQPKSAVIHHEGVSCGTQLDSSVKRYQSINQAKFAEKWVTELASYPDDTSQAGVAAASRRHSGSKTILVVDLYAPCYNKELAAHRIWELLKIFQQLDYHVIFLPDNGAKEQPYIEMLQDSSVEVIYRESERNLSVEQQLEQLLPLVDLAWVCRPQLYEKYAPLIRQYQQIKLVYDTVDLEYLRLQQKAELEDNSIQSMRQWVRMQMKELKAACDADLTITASSAEEEVLYEQNVSNLATIPDIHQVYEGKRPNFGDRRGILYFCDDEHPQNRDSVRWLIQDIMPLVWQQIPELTITLLSNASWLETATFGEDSRITIAGYTSDLAHFLLNHRIFIAPLKHDKNIKSLIGQSLNLGLPIVSNEVGIKAMNLTDRKDVLKAGNKEEFVQKTIQLYRDEQLWDQLANNGKDAIANHNPKYVKAKIEQVLNNVLSKS